MWSSHVPFMGKAFSSFSCTALLVAWHSQWKKQRERERDETHIIRTSKWKMKTVTISFENENEKNAHTIWHNQKEEEKNGAANAMAKQKRCECFFFGRARFRVPGPARLGRCVFGSMRECEMRQYTIFYVYSQLRDHSFSSLQMFVIFFCSFLLHVSAHDATTKLNEM